MVLVILKHIGFSDAIASLIEFLEARVAPVGSGSLIYAEL